MLLPNQYQNTLSLQERMNLYLCWELQNQAKRKLRIIHLLLPLTTMLSVMIKMSTDITIRYHMLALGISVVNLKLICMNQNQL